MSDYVYSSSSEMIHPSKADTRDTSNSRATDVSNKNKNVHRRNCSTEQRARWGEENQQRPILSRYIYIQAVERAKRKCEERAREKEEARAEEQYNGRERSRGILEKKSEREREEQEGRKRAEHILG